MTLRTVSSPATRGLLLGFIGVSTFSVTLPVTRTAVTVLDPMFVGMGRAVIAAIFAGIYLLAGRHRLPTATEWKGLVLVSLGAVIAFPILTALAMKTVDASHGGVVLGILPLTTAAAGALLYHERPSARFWWFAIGGSLLVVMFSLLRSNGALSFADMALLGAVLTVCVSYAAGARLAQTLGGLQVISWALVLAFPFLLYPSLQYAPASWDLPMPIWLSFGYVCLISQFLGFWPWYKGLALGGIARVSQVQLLQPFLTVAAAALLTDEKVDAMTVVFAVLVFAVVALGRKFR